MYRTQYNHAQTLAQADSHSSANLFQSFFQAGFECSTHKVRGNKRLDLISATRHDVFAARDFKLLRQFGITTVREGARWHLIEAKPGRYDFSSLSVILDAADASGMQVILDLLHFGWPDYLDIFQPDFTRAFAQFTFEMTRYLQGRGIKSPLLAPVNEVSFLSWAGADQGFINPFVKGRAHDLKQSLMRATIVSSEVLLRELPETRLVAPEPVIHIVGDPEVPGSDIEAQRYSLAQYQAWDMLSGRMAPELGGRPEYLDIIGLNFYDRNEWVHNHKDSLKRNDVRYRPFRQILSDVWGRYRRKLFVSETGTEGEQRVDWLTYVCEEVRAAIHAGVPVLGICLYPIVNHPGWDDDRYCCNGLFDYPDSQGNREVYEPLARVLHQERQRGFERTGRENYHDQNTNRSTVLFSSALGIRLSTAATPDEPLCEATPGLFL